MKLNRKWLLAIALLLSMTMAVSGTLAYLTDRDSEANVFTVGNVEIDLTEDFEQGATLIPGVGIEKKPYITNTGNNDAWVWLEVAIPSALDHWATDTEEGSNNNGIHWNQLGATTANYVTEDRVTNAIAAGHLPKDITFDKINSNNMTWNLGGKEAFSTQKEIEVNGEKVEYNCYVIGYNKPLTKGESTLTNIYKFTLDKRVDIDPDGNMFFVENGEVTDLKWNINTDGNPVIYVSAYAMQEDGFATVNEAIRAYNEQWGDNGTEYADPDASDEEVKNGDDPSVTYEAPANAFKVNNAEELKAAVAEGYTVIALADGQYDVDGCGGKNLSLYGSKNAVLKVMNEGEDGCDYGFGSAGAGVGKVTFNGLTIDTTANTGNYKGYAYMGATFNDCTFVGAYSLNNANDFEFNYCDFDFKNGYFWTWGANSATFNNCTFNGNSKCILAHGWASTQITINNCKFAATEKGYTGSGHNTACVEIDPAGTNTYAISFTRNNTKTDSYSGWTRVKDGSTGHVIIGIE